ncbi:MAG: cobaltochelatase subunit CobN, partial [Cyanobacteria bacterium P01_A01_bin.105]
MHRLKAMPGGWMPGEDGVVFIDQTPAPLVVMTAADTDIQAIYQGLGGDGASLTTVSPSPFNVGVRVVNLLNLQQQLAIDTYADAVLRHAQGIVVRLLGGRAYWSYGLGVVKQLAVEQGIALAVLPGDTQPNLTLMHHSTLPLAQVNDLWRYFVEGGGENLRHGLQYLSDVCLETQYAPPAPKAIPAVGIYRAAPDKRPDKGPDKGPDNRAAGAANGRKKIGADVAILFYRSHFLAENTAPIDALYEQLLARGLSPVAIYVASLQAPEVQQTIRSLIAAVGLVINTTSFAIARPAAPNRPSKSTDFWSSLDVPVLQVILSGDTEARWQASPLGLSPREVAMNVALPEVDGRIITRAVSFKSVTAAAQQLETDIVTYRPVPDRVAFVASLAANWITLRQTPVANRRIALVLANYPNRDGRLANGVGLDTPASCVALLQALQSAGYGVEGFPQGGDDLIRHLVSGVTNDPEGLGWRPVRQALSLQNYHAYFESLPEAVQTAVRQRWGTPEGEFAVAGQQYGQVFVGIQPSRGYDRDPSLNYHAPDLEPTPDYLAFYHWLRHDFQAHAIVHVGKHGNLEWLPGKGLALGETCYPEVALGPLPHFYPFIVNDPGEGSQAKRRAQAVIVDHLTPPLTRAELYGPLLQLESLVDEYYDAQTLDPNRVPVIAEKIAAVLGTSHLGDEIGLTPAPADRLETVLPTLDGYLCELKEAQIRDGLHILGQCPQGRQLRDLVVAIARHPNGQHIGLSRAIAQNWGLTDL